MGTQVDLTPAEYSWVSGDMTPPVVTILTGPTLVSAPESTTTSTSATFTFSSNEPDAEFECALDPVGLPQWSQCAAPPDRQNRIDDRS